MVNSHNYFNVCVSPQCSYGYVNYTPTTNTKMNTGDQFSWLNYTSVNEYTNVSGSDWCIQLDDYHISLYHVCFFLTSQAWSMGMAILSCTLWLAYRYWDQKFNSNSTGTSSRSAECSGTGTGIELQDLQVLVQHGWRWSTCSDPSMIFRHSRGITSSTFLCSVPPKTR